MEVKIEVAWFEYDEEFGENRLHDIRDGIDVDELRDRYSNYTDTPVTLAWKWINEMYQIPNPSNTIKNFELIIKF